MPLSTTDWLFQEKSSDRKKSNPNYLVVITCNEQNINLIANLPQDFGTNVRSTYDSPFSQMISEKFGQGVQNAIKGLGGVQLTTKALTAQVWQGVSDFTFDLPLVFQAIDDEYQDVTEKLLHLHQLTLPGENSAGFLTAPGPYLDPLKIGENLLASGEQRLKDVGNAIVQKFGELRAYMSSSSNNGTASNSPNQVGPTNTFQKRPLASCIKNNISVKIGQYMYFESVVIDGISVQHKVQPLESGTMSAVEVLVTFKTFYSPVKSDLETMFVNSRRSSNLQQGGQ